MQASTQEIEAIKANYESQLIAIDGVESVSIGIGSDGKPCLMIGLSLPESQVRERIPAELFTSPVEFMFIGKIGAQ